MRTIFLLAVTGMTVTSAWAADTLSRGERDFALSQLHSSRKLFLDSVAGLSEEQWNYKPAPDRWSVAECAEHIALSEDFIAGMAKKALATPAEPDKKIPAGEARGRDEKVIAMVLDRSHKAQAPEPIQPSRKFKTPMEAVAHFRSARGANIDYIDTTQDELRVRFVPVPGGGPLDLYQWFLLIAAHSERHVQQLQEVKAGAGFPKSQTLSRSDRDFALSQLHASRKKFLDSIAGVSDAQWNYKPGPDRWSVAECAEHIVLTEELIMGGVRQTLQGMAHPEDRLAAGEARTKDTKILALVNDRSQKAQAPEVIRPTHRFKTPADVAEAFRRTRDVNVEYVDSTTDDLRAFTMTHPLLGKMDAYEFILLMSAHAERHTQQIAEVKADAGYPRK